MNRRRYMRNVICKDIQQAVVAAADGCVATLLAVTYIHIGLNHCWRGRYPSDHLYRVGVRPEHQLGVIGAVERWVLR